MEEKLFKCCGSKNWVSQMVKLFPFDSQEKLLLHSKLVWSSLDKKDWLEAFAAHPKIGDLDSLKKKFSTTLQFTSNEQSGVDPKDEATLEELAKLNHEYERKFGYIFIVCATGKTAPEILEILRPRLRNSPEEEIRIGAEEQQKITEIRLKQLFPIAEWEDR